MLKIIFYFIIATDTLFVFYSPRCPHCKEAIDYIKKSNIPYRLMNLENDSIMMLLDSLETKLKVHQDEIPVFYYKGKLYYGSLDSIVPKHSNTLFFSSPNICENCKRPIREPHFPKGKLYFVYAPGCRECSRFAKKLDKLKKYYNLPIEEVSSFDSLGLLIINALKDAKLYKKIPFLLVGDTVLYKLPSDKDMVLSIVNRHASKKLNVKASKIRKSEILTLPTTVVAGLIDGINPCAFTVILFLIGFLSYKKRKKNESFLILISFSMGIFLAYFSIGIGLYGILEALNKLKVLEMALRLFIGLFALILGIITFRDGILMIKTNKSNIGGLSLSEKQKTHAIIRKYIDKGLVKGAFFMGLFISFVEFACTGQIYLPTLSYISKHEGITMTKLFFLLIYNITFLIPLIIIGLSAIFIEHRSVAKKLNKNTPYIKFATSFLFFGLGALIIFF